MARMGCLLGVLLIGFAVVALFTLVVIPVLPFGENNPTLMQIKGALVCEPGQQYVMEGHNFSDNRGSGRRFNVYCVGDDGTKLDVIEKDFLVSLVLFVVPFLVGLFLTIGASAGLARGVTRNVLQDVSGFQMGQAGSLNVGGMQIRVQRSGNPSMPIDPNALLFGDQSVTLADKLKQLEQARTQGLISQEEYDRVRKRILDESV
jgi:hypothetical protein